ncbi:MAG: c-type cytochrome, partial [Usitatibacter sp.]
MRLTYSRLAAFAACAFAAAHAAAQDDAATRKLAETCAACHGPDGNSPNPAYPILAGQTWRYIYIQLKDFKEGRRTDPVMSSMAANLGRDEMIALGNYFAARK